MKSKSIAAFVAALTLMGTSRGVVFAEEIDTDEINTTTVTEEIFSDDDDTTIVMEEIFVDDNDTETLVGKEFCFPNGGEVIRCDGSVQRICPRERFYVISRSSDGVYRIYIPKSLDIFFLQQNVSLEEMELINSDGLILGDLDHNGRLDTFDLCALKNGVIYGWADIHAYYMGDVNADNSVNIADVVCMQKYLLGVEA